LEFGELHPRPNLGIRVTSRTRGKVRKNEIARLGGVASLFDRAERSDNSPGTVPALTNEEDAAHTTTCTRQLQTYTTDQAFCSLYIYVFNARLRTRNLSQWRHRSGARNSVIRESYSVTDATCVCRDSVLM